MSNTVLVIRNLRQEDEADVVAIDALHTGQPKAAYWKSIFQTLLNSQSDTFRVGLGVFVGGALQGYLLGEARAFEFGSERCGWIFSVGINPQHKRGGLGSALMTEAVSQFRAAGIDSVRTMVRRNNIPILTFFRSNGFVGGPFVQLELGIKND